MYQDLKNSQGLICYMDGSQKPLEDVAKYEFIKPSATFYKEDGTQECYSAIKKIVRLPYGFFQIIFDNHEIYYLPMQEIQKLETDPEIIIMDLKTKI